MKKSKLNLVLKASLKADRLLNSLFFIFVLISSFFLFVAISVICPLWHNIDAKINNHILQREIVVSFRSDYTDAEIQKCLKQIREIGNIEDIYEFSFDIGVSEESGVLFSQYNLDFNHKYHTPAITEGRCFSEDETGVVLVPHIIEDYNGKEGKINVINGSDLVGKTLKLKDEAGVVHKLKVIGSYDATDPIYKDNELLIPLKELQKYKKYISENSESYMSTYTDDKSFIVVVESPQYVSGVLEEAEYITTAYCPAFPVDTQLYNMAFFILIGIFVLLVIITIFGFFMFLKCNINANIQKLALYKAIGYKSGDIYYILFGKHFTLSVLPLIMGICSVYLINTFIINPYLYGVVGNTFMNMTADLYYYEIIPIVCGYIAVLVLVCVSAVKKVHKIDLTILLRSS